MAAKIVILVFATLVSQITPQPILLTETTSLIPVGSPDCSVQTILSPLPTPCSCQASFEPEVYVDFSCFPVNPCTSCSKGPTIPKAPVTTVNIPFVEVFSTPVLGNPSCVDYNNIVQTPPVSSVSLSEATSYITSNLGYNNVPVTQNIQATAVASAGANIGTANSIERNNLALVNSETISAINSYPALDIGPSLCIQPTGYLGIESFCTPCGCSSLTQPVIQSNFIPGSSNLAFSDAYSSVTVGPSNNYGNINVGQPNYINSYISTDTVASTNTGPQFNVIQPLSSSKAISSTRSYGGINNLASADAIAFSATNKPFIAPKLCNIPQPIPIAQTCCEVPIKLNNFETPVYNTGITGCLGCGSRFGVDTISPASLSVFEYCQPSCGNSYSPLSESINEINTLINCICPLIEIIDKIGPLCSNQLGCFGGTSFIQPGIQISPSLSGISEVSSSTATASVVDNGSLVTSSATSSVVTSTDSNPCDVFIDNCDCDLNVASLNNVNTPFTPFNDEVSSSCSSATSVAVVEEVVPVQSASCVTYLPYNPYSVFKLPASPIIFEMEIPSYISTCVSPGFGGLESANYLSSCYPSPVEYEVLFPSAIPAQVSCSLGSIPTTQPVVSMCLEPLCAYCC